MANVLATYGGGRRTILTMTDPSIVATHHCDGLIDRQYHRLELVASGLTNPEIAAALFMSAKTVIHHSGRIDATLGVRGRADAVGLAARHGLLGAR